ncbi:toxin-antitoxin system YwqK family antitoxin [Flavobacterium sp. 3HN19-14]|uniref:toxin-antitoxin system YwqK family antitoxin n=1 Tax=Flavobacterium sp. 3HN19-14 TaxID=3448133 RepID=UPI003EE254F6
MKNIRSAALLVLLLSFSQYIIAQEFNKLDASGKKNGLWKGIYEESKRPRYEGTFDHGVETGTFKYFDDTKAKSVIATRVFSENGTVAYTTFFDQKGNVVSEGKTVNRLNEGEWKYYHEESKAVMTTENYTKGKVNGVRKVFYKEGGIAEEATYIDDVKNGHIKNIPTKELSWKKLDTKTGNLTEPPFIKIRKAISLRKGLT